MASIAGAEDAPAPDPKEAVHAALARPITVDFENVPLHRAIRWLADKAQIAISLDRKATDDAGVDLQTPVTLKLGPAKLRRVLRRLNDPLELVAVPRGDLLLITTRDEAGQIIETRVYDVRDLYDYDARDKRRLDPDVRDDDLLTDAHELVSLVQYAVSDSPWAFSGGPSSIGPFGGTLVVSQTAEAHDRILAFLARLRRVLRQRETKQLASPAERPEAALERKLQQQVRVEFENRPLQEILDALAKEHKLDFSVDRKALSDAGLDGPVPITIHLANTSLDTVLREMFRPYDLICVVGEDDVLVTTVDEAGQMVYPEIYDVHDMIVPQQLIGDSPPDDGPPAYDPQSLIDVVTSTIAPTTWSAGTGPGDGAFFAGTVTWVQTQAVHAQIAELIRELRRVHQKPVTPLVPKPSDSPQPVADPKALELRVYKLSWSEPSAPGEQGSTASPARSSDAALRYTQQVGQAIVSLIERDSWEEHGGKGVLRATPSNEPHTAGTLLVRQTAAVHKQIAKLLRNLQTGPRGGWGGGIFP
jgi:hypothetical protein